MRFYTSRVFIIFLIIGVTNHSQLYASLRKCEIKYGEEDSLKSLNEKFLEKNINNLVKEKGIPECYQIGVEHTKEREPILNKPIYACCLNF